MKPFIDVFSTHTAFKEEEIKGRTVVVIDVLRATSTITTALVNGAKSVVPVEDMGEAGKIAQNLDPSRYLLCGEKDGMKIDTYHLGNSPMEYTPEVVKGKTLIFNTTNGSKAIVRTNTAANVYIGSFLNLNAVIERLKTHDSEILVICAGWKGRLSLEDMLCAGAVIHGLMEGELWDSSRDGAMVAFGLYEKYGDRIEEIISRSNHATRLKKLSDNDDVSYCCKMNTFDIIPKFKDGIITAS